MECSKANIKYGSKLWGRWAWSQFTKQHFWLNQLLEEQLWLQKLDFSSGSEGTSCAWINSIFQSDHRKLFSRTQFSYASEGTSSGSLLMKAADERWFFIIRESSCISRIKPITSLNWANRLTSSLHTNMQQFCCNEALLFIDAEMWPPTLNSTTTGSNPQTNLVHGGESRWTMYQSGLTAWICLSSFWLVYQLNTPIETKPSYETSQIIRSTEHH